MIPFHGLTVETLLSMPFSVDRHRMGRARVHLGRGHRLAQVSGQQWRARAVAMVCLRQILLPNEHVHHQDGNVLNDHPSNLAVVLAEYHGAMTCAFVTLAKPKGGELVELPIPEPWPEMAGFRRGPVLSARRIPESAFEW